MPDYQKMYTCLFNAITDALGALNDLNIGETRERLIRAQQQAEELYLEEE